MSTQQDNPKAGSLYWMRWFTPIAGILLLAGSFWRWKVVLHGQLDPTVWMPAILGVTYLVVDVFVERQLYVHRYDEYRRILGRPLLTNKAVRELLKQVRKTAE